MTKTKTLDPSLIDMTLPVWRVEHIALLLGFETKDPIYTLIPREGFPAPRRLSPRGRMLWFADEIIAWLRQQPVEARAVSIGEPTEGLADLPDVLDGRRGDLGVVQPTAGTSFADLPDAVRHGVRA